MSKYLLDIPIVFKKIGKKDMLESKASLIAVKSGKKA